MCFASLWCGVQNTSRIQNKNLNSDLIYLILRPGYGNVDGTRHNGVQGPGNMISLGTRGFLAVAQRHKQRRKSQIGLAKLPIDMADCDHQSDGTANPSKCAFDWTSVDPEPNRVYSWDRDDPNFNLCADPTPHSANDQGDGKARNCTRGLGFATLEHLGPGGEEGGRVSLGWAENVGFSSYSKTYFVQEIAENGTRYGTPLALEGVTGWGETAKPWSQFQSGPAAGCVTWPYVWAGQNGPGYSYGPGDQRQDSFLIERVHVTVVCPTDRTSTTPAVGAMPPVVRKPTNIPTNTAVQTTFRVLLPSLLLVATVCNSVF